MQDPASFNLDAVKKKIKKIKGIRRSSFMKIILFVLIPLILSMGIFPVISFGEMIDSTKKQMANGVAVKDIVCKSGFTLMIRISGNAACVMPTTAEQLENRGWGVIEKEFRSNSEDVKITLTPDEAKSISEEAYIFGYPLVIMGITLERLSNVSQAGELHAPMNQFAHLPAFPDMDFKEVVRPNNDTLYSSAVLDLSQEPIILHVSDTQDRYYLLPMLDAWSNVFASPGKRTTGTESNDFAITGPFWEGTLPEGVTEIKSPTELAWIIGRTQTNGVEDYDFVHSIQQGYTLTPLSSFGEPYAPPQNVPVDSTIDMTIPPVEKVDQLDADSFFNRMSMLMKSNPSAPEDADMLVEFEKIGLIPGQEFNSSDLDPEVLSAIESGAISGRQKIESNIPNIGTIENGWLKSLDMGSYGTDYLLRATVGLVGLGANVAEDAIYPAIYQDSDDNMLNGANNYTIHFPEGQTPPVNAFWSVTMYGKDNFLVENPIDRYTIGDRSELVYNDDGSLDIYLQHEAPDGNESNWLPAPDDDFNLLMRLYWPSQEIIDGTWEMPDVELVK